MIKDWMCIRHLINSEQEVYNSACYLPHDPSLDCGCSDYAEQLMFSSKSRKRHLWC